MTPRLKEMKRAVSSRKDIQRRIGILHICRLLLFGLLAVPAGIQIMPALENVSAKQSLEVSLSRIARVTPDASGNYEFFRVDASPDDPRHAMVCTLHLSALTDEESAEVFTSADGGETWALRLRDSSSRDVSEDACAFGEGGRAYFIAQPWNVKSPYALHPRIDQSEMRLYRSSNYGENWPAHLTSDFVDYARIVVDTRASSTFRGRAYIVGNRTAKQEFPLLTVLAEGKHLVSAKQGGTLADLQGRHGQYPRSLIVLGNGDVLASYTFVHEGTVSAVVTATKDGGNTLTGPVSIDKDACPSGSPSIAENPENGALFAFYARKFADGCAPAIAFSKDEGLTWKPLSFSLAAVVGTSGVQQASPQSIAFRKDGVGLLTWSSNSVQGAVFEPGWKLLWTGEISAGDANFAVNLAPYIRRDDRLAEDSGPEMDVSLQFGFSTRRDVEASVQADGTFLVLWREEDGQLYSRSIHVVPRQVPAEIAVLPRTDVTPLVRYEARNITFDANSRVFEYDLSLVNVSSSALQGPLVFRITQVTTTIGPISLKDFSGNQVVFVPERSSVLLPGEETRPEHIRLKASAGWREAVVFSARRLPRVALFGRVYAEIRSQRE